MKDKVKNGRYVDALGAVYWYKDGLFHREDGPALEWADGSKEWYLDGQRHRLDGPAIEYLGVYKAWYKNGQFHREDGPAYESANGGKEWCLNGVLYTEEEFNQWLEKKKLNERLEYTLEEKPSVKKVKI